MELIIIIAVSVAAAWYFFFRDKELVKEAVTEAPYKVETEPKVETTVQSEVKPVDPEPAAEITKVETAEVVLQKSKRATKPKAAKAEKTTKTVAKPKVKKPKMTVVK